MHPYSRTRDFHIPRSQVPEPVTQPSTLIALLPIPRSNVTDTGPGGIVRSFSLSRRAERQSCRYTACTPLPSSEIRPCPKLSSHSVIDPVAMSHFLSFCVSCFAESFVGVAFGGSGGNTGCASGCAFISVSKPTDGPPLDPAPEPRSSTNETMVWIEG